jgi:hypothetical protein
MGKWDTVINDEFDGHLVVVEVRRPNDQPDIGQDGQPGLRVTITCLRDCDDETSGQTSMTTDDPAGALITLGPDTVDDLEGGSDRGRLQHRSCRPDLQQGLPSE